MIESSGQINDSVRVCSRDYYLACVKLTPMATHRKIFYRNVSINNCSFKSADNGKYTYLSADIYFR